MKNKKIILVLIIIVVILAIAFAIYEFYTSRLIGVDGKLLPNAHEELINHIANTENEAVKHNMINFSLESNLITQEEANALY